MSKKDMKAFLWGHALGKALVTAPLTVQLAILEEMLEHAKQCENCNQWIPFLERKISELKVGS